MSTVNPKPFFKPSDGKVIGIVGGMGPQSGLALLNSVLNNTHAKSDQQHLSAILMSFPSIIGDRTQFLEGNIDINPAYNIAKVIAKLEVAGAEIVGMSCNTSHSPQIYDVIVEELEKQCIRVKLVSMTVETCKYMTDNLPFVRKVGLMTTNGTYKSGVYRKLLESSGYTVILPDFQFQDNVIHRMIYDLDIGIKSNPANAREKVDFLIDKVLDFFKKNETEVIILGCTELSIVFTEKTVQGMILVDSTDVMAKALVREAREKIISSRRNLSVDLEI